MSAVIEITGLRKEYYRFRRGRTQALSGLDLEVPEGGVFGFLGPNGSGKTTTIHCLLGLVRPNAGRARILGADPQRDLATVIRRIGSIVETPALFPGFSGRRNLRLLAGLAGVRRKKVDEILETVGLSDRARDRVRTYSLGMKQRLGIGAALLKDPELLLLDEPANGLDPAGIKEVRDLLRRLADQGRTVFVSSHILSEVQQLADRVAILARGRCVAAGAVADVLAAGRATGIVVRLDDLPRGLAVLRSTGIDATLEGDIIRSGLSPGEAGRITKALADESLYVTELRPDTVDLETVFLDLTRDVEEEQP